MKNRIITSWKSHAPMLATVAACMTAGLFCSVAVAGDELFLPAAEVVAPAAKTVKAQPAATDPKKKSKPAEAAVNKAKAEAKQKAAALQQRGFAQRAVANAGIEQQIRAQLEPMLKVELSFANRAAGLNDDERRKLIAGGKKWFDDFVGPFVKNQDPNQRQMMLQGVNGVWFGGQAPNRDDPRKSIQTGIAKVVADTLPKEKANAYREECRKREEFNRSVTVDNVIVRIDEKVILSPEQRKKIAAALIKHWDESSPPQLEAFTISSTLWPGIPDQWVLPELTESQQAILSRINRTSGRVFMGGMGMGMGADVIDDINFDDIPSPPEGKKSD